MGFFNKFYSLDFRVSILLVVLGGIMFMEFQAWWMLPEVFKSQSTGKVVKVIDWRGQPLPASPLPKKYELVITR